jgi:hypothetical protein
MLWVWSGWSFAPDATDEIAYRLQAEIFASGSWKLPPRPLPEFFEQEHTFVTPFVAAKYPPGHSLLLAAGYLVGWPPLVPLVLIGLAGAFTFLLAKELTSAPVGLLTWTLWLTTPGNLFYLPRYFSELTTLTLWLLGWIALLKRARGGGTRWVVLLAACIGWGLITRPLTGLVYATVAGAALLYHEYRRRQVRPVASGILVGAAILLIVPLWSWRTTGDWKTTPLSLYTRMYDPWDVPGFGLDPTPPLRALPRDFENNFAELVVAHEKHTVSNLPRITLERLQALGPAAWMGWRLILAPFFIVGIISLTRAMLVGPLTALLLFVAYLSYAHMSHWIVYYVEALPVFAFVTALGVSALLRGGAAADESEPVFPIASSALRRIRIHVVANAQATIMSALAVAVLLGSVPLMSWARRTMSDETSLRRAFLAKIACLPTERNIVFVQYPATTDKSYLLVANDADLERSRAWIVFDRGRDNALLRRVAPTRAAYTISIPSGAMTALTPLDSAGAGDLAMPVTVGADCMKSRL